MAIFGEIQRVADQTAQCARLQKALDFAREVCNGDQSELRQRAAQLKAGDSFQIEIEGREVFAIFQAYRPRERKDGFFEAHKEHTDVQCLLQGEEYIEIAPLAELSKTPAYDQNQNVFFPLAPTPESRLLLKPGLAAVLLPEDAHAPTLRAEKSDGLNLKLVVKVHNAIAA